MTPQAGKHYRQRNGDVVGPLRPGNAKYRFFGGGSWTESGHWWEDRRRHDRDLVEEVE